MSKELTDEELLAELKRRIDLNKTMLEDERKLIRQLNEVNVKLIESEKMKSNFLSNIRNEINNPLVSILELAKNVETGNLSEDLVRQCAGMIRSEAFDLDFQLRNIFLSAEIEAGEAPVSPISLNINSVLQNVIDSFKNKMEKKNIHFSMKNRIEPDSIFTSDAEKLHLVVSNILANAIQFNKENGTVTMESSLENGYLTIAITDTGIGIEEDQFDKIYNRFYQIDGGSTKKYGGHGLGLTVTKAILEIINGEIDLTSTFGQGTTFTLKIKQLSSLDSSDIFSSDGNDFLFDQADDMLF